MRGLTREARGNRMGGGLLQILGGHDMTERSTYTTALAERYTVLLEQVL